MADTTQLPSSLSKVWELYLAEYKDFNFQIKVNDKLVSEIIEIAKGILAHPSRSTQRTIQPFLKHPFHELELEESFEEDPSFSEVDKMRVEVQEEKEPYCVCMLDLSSSMAGEKHLISSIAVAVFLLQIESTNSSLVVFSSKSKSIRSFQNKDSLEKSISEFLKFQPRGFTNIASGLKQGISQFQRIPREKKIGLLVSDGKTTEGLNPMKFASQFQKLGVLHLEGPGSDLEASQQLAQEGNGFCLPVETYENLPRKMYDALRNLLR